MLLYWLADWQEKDKAKAEGNKQTNVNLFVEHLSMVNLTLHEELSEVEDGHDEVVHAAYDCHSHVHTKY